MAATLRFHSVSELRFVWWNAYDFYDFRPEKIKRGGKSRWPSSRADYEEKCRRVDNALSELFSEIGMPHILCLGEITKAAAEELRDRMMPKYRVISLDVKADEPTLQVAVLYSEDSAEFSFVESMPIVVPRVPRGTRPMAVLDAKIGAHVIRFIACHWQARIDEEGSAKIRNRSAEFLSEYCYEFINSVAGGNHVVIVGDLNEEPFEKNLEVLNAHRHRARSLSKPHWTDKDVKRTHLYNLSWRLLGEKHPHASPNRNTDAMKDCAGTYYWESKSSWRTFDQVLVSGGLLESARPQISEAHCSIVSTDGFLTDGLPLKFERDAKKLRGLSDHLPISGKILI